MTDRYLGSLTVLDDDPAPKVTISRVEKRVSEGENATWRVTLSSRTDYSTRALWHRRPWRRFRPPAEEE